MKARDNPFSTDRVLRVRYRPQGHTWESLLDRLSALSYRASIVGPEGHGKTTLLEDLGARLPSLGLNPKPLRLTRERPTFPRAFLNDFFATTTSRDVILFDGAEQLGRFAWRAFLRRSRRAGGLLITSHRAGLLPTLVECQTSPALLREIVDQLTGPNISNDLAPAEALFDRHHGNVREALRELYDMHASPLPGTPGGRARVGGSAEVLSARTAN